MFWLTYIFSDLSIYLAALVSYSLALHCASIHRECSRRIGGSRLDSRDYFPKIL